MSVILAILARRCRVLLGHALVVAGLLTAGQRFTFAGPDTTAAEFGEIGTVRIEPVGADGVLTVRGRDGRQQLVVTGNHLGNRMSDVTRQVQFAVTPAELAQVDSTGFLIPLQDGEGQLEATLPSGLKSSVRLLVTGVTSDVPINFTNQIVPVFTKLQCNSGGCHGKASGQNSFKLSLLGFYPEDDYDYLVREGRGRRLFPTSPDQSLLLTKPTGRSPHGGGKRMEPDSYEYRIVRRWIEQGMPFGSDKDPHVVSIRCLPDARVMGRRAEQQLTVQAVYSDGTTEDVTRMALFEPNDAEMAEVTVGGLLKTHDLAGEVAVMARYQGQVAVFRSTIPLGAPVAGRPPVRNLIDDAVFAKLDLLGIPTSELCDDATFIRRVYVDVTGTTPTADEVSAFLADSRSTKRDELIDRLLDSPAYADLFANKWNMIFRNRRRPTDASAPTFAFHEWIWSSINSDKPYTQFVRDLVTASGDPDEVPAVAWYREVDQVNEQVEDVSQLFLGLRIQCARCHHHPFEKWSQDDYYGMAAFFSRVGRKTIAAANPQMRDRRIFHNDAAGPAASRNERTGKMLSPTGLGAAPLALPVEVDPRTALADWMTSGDNPFFAKSVVNRYWKHFFSRGIVEPEDDMRETNPPTNPQLLEGLAKQFAAEGYSLKSLVRNICRSSTYQLSSLPNEFNLKDKQNFSRYYPKRLQAEVIFDAFNQVAGSSETFGGYFPAGTRSTQLPDPGMGGYFLKVFGQPQADTACECERSQEANLAQSLHLLNSAEVQDKISNGNNRAALFAKDTTRPSEDKVRELYRWAYSREPDRAELEIAAAHLEKSAANPSQGWEDIIWALVNTKEFLFNH